MEKRETIKVLREILIKNHIINKSNKVIEWANQKMFI